MLSKNVKSIGLIVLLLALFFVRIYPVRAESHIGITNILPESIDVNAGSSIFIQLVIYNNDSVSHNFTIYWMAEGIDTFSSRGVIMPNEVKAFIPSFTFSNYGSHELNILLYEDDIQVETKTITINSQNFSMSLRYFFNSSTIYPGNNFTLAVTAINDGEKTVRNPILRLFPTELYDSGIILVSASSFSLNNLTKGRSQEITLDFRTSPNTQQGIYSLRVQLDYNDYDYSYERYEKYQKSYTIPIVIQSNQVLDELEQLHHDYNTLKDTVTKLQGTLQSMLYAIVAVLVISVLMAGINYYHAKRVYEQYRKKFKEKTK
jgi:hypothetical protein